MHNLLALDTGMDRRVLLGLLVTSAAVFMRLAVSLNPYSGAGKPPMYGDYEAQRHWMEITYNLPLREWYYNTSSNNLTYWGLDYPPLTAYHSWLCGSIADFFNPEWVELTTSQGHESQEHKLFMRYTVLIVDVLVFFSAVAVFVKVFWSVYINQWIGKDKPIADKESHNTETDLKAKLALILLLQPGLILIDYGHFQYNCVSLGLALWGIVGVISNHYLLGSIAFSLALNYKQMELYHALPFFFFLLGKSFNDQSTSGQIESEQHMSLGKKAVSKQAIMCRGLFSAAKLAIVVTLSFLLLWLPFILTGGMGSVLQVLKRLFPISRGLYEDKVANFWCSLSVLVKVRQLFPHGFLVVGSTGMTLMAALPSSLYLLWHPQSYHFLLALVNSSLSFFLFSFQVHEKSILLACLPVSLLTPFHPFLATTFQLVATFSMYPLLTQDGLCLAAWALCCLFSLVSILFLKRTQFEMPILEMKVKALFLSLLAILLTLSTLSHVIPPPPSLPHIFSVLISGVSFIQFVLFYLYFNLLTFTGKINHPFTTGSKNGGKRLSSEKTDDKKTTVRPLDRNYPLPFGVRGTTEYIHTLDRETVRTHGCEEIDSSQFRMKTHTD